MMATTMKTTASTERRAVRFLLALSLPLFLVACGTPAGDEHAGEHGDEHGHEHGEGETFSVTAWGERYEVFPEIGLLTAGEPSSAHVHVTVFHPDGTSSPLTEGRVAVVLRAASGEESFAAAEAERSGVFEIELAPRQAGERELLFRVASAAGEEEIRGGRVLVGGDGEAGRLLVAPAPRGAGDGGEPLEFSKEDQWSSDFATAWVRRGALQRGVEGLARVEPPAGGEAVVTAPFEAVVATSPWPHPGQRVRRGETLFRLLPRVEAGRSLAALESDKAALEAELVTARGRLERLEELLDVEAVSRREVEEARAREAALSARHDAASRDLQAARSARQGGGGGEAIAVSAPLAGEVSAVNASPGAAVAGGETLARLVRTDLVWLAVAVPTEESPAALAAGGLAGAVVEPAAGEPFRLAASEVRLVAVAPEVDPANGTVDVLVETAARPGLVLGTVVDVELLAAETVEGIVIPSSALVDDGGVSVVYLQLSGERFARQAVRVVERQGDRALVEGLVPGQRLVTRGGNAVRRSSLMGSGDSHGHVH